MSQAIEYSGSLTREQFLFYEGRITASLLCQGLSREEALAKIQEENLFQFPTERMITSITKTCFRRIDALNNQYLVENLANAPLESAKQINLYAMMKYNRIVWDFMTGVIGEKYRTRALDFSKKDLNLFFYRLQEQNKSVASWSDSTIEKTKQVLKKSLVECNFLETTKSEYLNPVLISTELEFGIQENHDLAALPAFNCFT